MGNRSSSTLIAILLLAAALVAQAPQPPAEQSTAQRAADRIRALQQESEALARQERSLLGELRRLEVERELKTAELSTIQQDLVATQAQIASTTTRAAALEETARAERPDVESRVVQIYKLGRAGYWRMLFDVEDLGSVGRAYRTASALARLDRERVQQHARTLEQLAAERRALEDKAAATVKLRQRATAARAAIDRAVASRNELIDSIDARRDLNAQLVGELEAAAAKLRSAVSDLGGERAAPPPLPIAAFRGALAWPARGVVVGRFGRQLSSRFGTTVARNGIDLSLAEGTPVRAVHEGIVAYAAPFTGYGNLVILDHGGGAYSLYGHLSSLLVARGERIAVQAPVGNSGRNPSGNPALYFELRVDDKPVDPLQWLKKQP